MKYQNNIWRNAGNGLVVKHWLDGEIEAPLWQWLLIIIPIYVVVGIVIYTEITGC